MRPKRKDPHLGEAGECFRLSLHNTYTALFLSGGVKRRILASSEGGQRHQPECVRKLLSTCVVLRMAVFSLCSSHLGFPPLLLLVYTCILGASAIPPLGTQAALPVGFCDFPVPFCDLVFVRVPCWANYRLKVLLGKGKRIHYVAVERTGLAWFGQREMVKVKPWDPQTCSTS
ncbi:hypothetical protein MJT46_014158 [Ovis ammon polii x Ovis aries]|nr:hypothetical protein MJT46_014158 [Ovis ammon polii x Ovis aries]